MSTLMVINKCHGAEEFCGMFQVGEGRIHFGTLAYILHFQGINAKTFQLPEYKVSLRTF